MTVDSDAISEQVEVHPVSPERWADLAALFGLPSASAGVNAPLPSEEMVCPLHSNANEREPSAREERTRLVTDGAVTEQAPPLL